ncbi:MAG: hypothetical protein R6W78_11610 [Bacteroidales bacterium]
MGMRMRMGMGMRMREWESVVVVGISPATKLWGGMKRSNTN